MTKIAGMGRPDVTAFLKEQNPILAAVLVLGASIVVGTVLGSASVWLIQRARGDVPTTE